jgi:Zn finger protein HypA/HybF involved in hydrogenase expression
MLNVQGDELEEHGGFFLNRSYWDCCCDDDYIKRKADMIYCPKCDCHEVDYPDSRENEVQEMLGRV